MVRVQIVPLTDRDFEQAADILSACSLNPQRELSEYMQNDAALVLCSKTQDCLTGCICLLFSVDTCDLLDIAVKENYRRKGIAKKLLEYSFDVCKNRKITNVMLEVRKSNLPAIRFYEKNGFEQISVRKKYYTAPIEDAIIYRREL